MRLKYCSRGGTVTCQNDSCQCGRCLARHRLPFPLQTVRQPWFPDLDWTTLLEILVTGEWSEGLRRELAGQENALLCHHQLLQARCDDPALNAIFRSTQSTAEDCQKCIEAFSQATVKFDRSLGVDPSGNVCRDVMMKVRWQMSKKEEVVRFRAQLGQHISSLNMHFALANL